MYQDSAGTVAAVLESPVGKQLDLSGNNNHRTQTTNAYRPTLSARYNLLTKTEQFDNAAWVSTNVTKTANSLTETAVTGNHFVLQTTSSQAAVLYSYSVECAPNGRTWAYIQFTIGAQAGGAWFQLTGAGTVGNTAGTLNSKTITALTDGYYKLTITKTITVAGNIEAAVFIASANGTTNYAGDITKGIYVRNADARPANQATGLIPTYQSVDTSSVYDTVGFPQYLKYDGLNSSLSTASINFTATAQMSAFAGVRKVGANAAASIGMVAELSTAAGTNAGSFFLSEGGVISYGNKYGCALQGSTLIYSDSATSWTPPITNTLSTLMNIPAATPALQQILNINGVQQTVIQAGSGAGTGNFGNYAMYFGARAGTSLFTNGYEFQTIIVGKTLTAAQITATETYVNSKTKAY
jgi:hypothetical protein